MVVKLNIFETPQPDRHLIARSKTEVYAKSEVAAWLKQLREELEDENIDLDSFDDREEAYQRW